MLNLKLKSKEELINELQELHKENNSLKSLYEKTKAEFSLSEEKFKTLVEYTNIVPWKFDLKKNKFTYIGKQVKDILGYPDDSWTDLDSWANRIHPEDREKSKNLCISASERGESHDFEYRCIDANGEIVWIKDIITLVF